MNEARRSRCIWCGTAKRPVGSANRHGGYDPRAGQRDLRSHGQAAPSAGTCARGAM